GHRQQEEQKRRYASAEFQYVAFDELTGFTQSQYEFLFSRLRRPVTSRRVAADGTGIADVPLRMRTASNPGGPGHMWVRRKLVLPETRRDGVVFVPALLHENPHLDQQSYERSLSHLGATERARLLRGDWAARDAGSLFDGSAFRLIEPGRYAPTSDMRRVRYWDLAATEPGPSNPDPDWTVGLRMAWRPVATGLHAVDSVAKPVVHTPEAGDFVIEAIERLRATPAQI